jgi:TolB-like protein
MEGSGWKAGETRSRGGLEYVAVLPIVSGVEEELVFLGNRITSCLTDGLSTIRGVRVIGREHGEEREVGRCESAQSGQKPGVQTMLAGELTRHGVVLHLRMELIDVADGRQIRGAHAEGISQNGAPCEVEVAEAILQQIGPVLVRVSSKMRVVRETGLVADRKMTAG